MSIYNNNFQYYRGQSRDKTDEAPTRQLENNVTKAFLNVLEHADLSLLQAFCGRFGLKAPSEQPEFRFQVGTGIQSGAETGVVLAIAKASTVYEDAETGARTIADGAICSPEASIVIEIKIGNDSLYQSQLNGHQRLLVHAKRIQPCVIITWEDVFEFLGAERSRLVERNDKLSCWLIQQFLEFGMNNCIAKDSLEFEDIFRLFPTEEERNMAKEIHAYIMSHAEWRRSVTASIPKRGDCIEYKRNDKPRSHFLTVSCQNSPSSKVGDEWQRSDLH